MVGGRCGGSVSDKWGFGGCFVISLHFRRREGKGGRKWIEIDFFDVSIRFTGLYFLCLDRASPPTLFGGKAKIHDSRQKRDLTPIPASRNTCVPEQISGTGT
jgi:hypothetical protein